MTIVTDAMTKKFGALTILAAINSANVDALVSLYRGLSAKDQKTLSYKLLQFMERVDLLEPAE